METTSGDVAGDISKTLNGLRSSLYSSLRRKYTIPASLYKREGNKEQDLSLWIKRSPPFHSFSLYVSEALYSVSVYEDDDTPAQCTGTPAISWGVKCSAKRPCTTPYLHHFSLFHVVCFNIFFIRLLT